MDISLHSSSGKKAGSLTVSDAVFAAEYNEPLVHQVVVAYMNAARAGTKAQKTRAEVSGGNSKPFKQKGTGRARAGTTRGPLWRTGGRAFAARPRSYEQKVNRKMYRQAMRSILSELIRQDRLSMVENFAVDAPKTKSLIARLSEMSTNNALIIIDSEDRNLYLAARNVPHVDVVEAKQVDPVSLINFEKVLVTKAAMQQLEARLS
ncbi:MAG: 50S ribosomal protein L4 [Gammaproteobacteria bacterium]|nr:50S ribosomal protein L4 [Gammaproteobacteria bacterium]